jgi:hypothetical protein
MGQPSVLHKADLTGFLLGLNALFFTQMHAKSFCLEIFLRRKAEITGEKVCF